MYFVCFLLSPQVAVGSDFPGNVNLGLGIAAVIAILLFSLEVGINLILAYFDNVRATRFFFTVPVVGYLFRALARYAEKRKSWEPIVVYDVANDSIQLVAAKRSRALKLTKKQSASRINYKERQYFLKVMGETLGFAVVHMKLDVIPGIFLEFVLRLGFASHRLDELRQESKKSLQAIAGGDIAMLADWSKQQNTEMRKETEEAEKWKSEELRKSASLELFFKQIEAKIYKNQDMSKEEKERRKDLGKNEFSETETEDEKKEEKQEESDSDLGERFHIVFIILFKYIFTFFWV